MAKVATVLGLMSGTSMDGIDLALLRTDGDMVADRLDAGFVPYPEEVRAQLRAILGKSADNAAGDVTAAAKTVTDLHIKAASGFLAKSADKPDLVGFHGQTIFHDPANARTWQLGDGQALADALGIDVVYDFRANDMAAGGQGAPLLPLYHRALMQKAGMQGPACMLNLGGVGNITWVDGDMVIACDTGPANALIDDWMLAQTGLPMDTDGATAVAGTPDMARINEWLAHPFFKLPPPKSLDRNAFAHCTVDGMTLADGAATLAAFTVDSVLAALRLMPAMPHTLAVAGGGRHNRAIMARLNTALRTVTADTLGWPGDTMEAEGFAYLARRSVLGLPLSLPTTTGCKAPTTGGKLARTNNKL